MFKECVCSERVMVSMVTDYSVSDAVACRKGTLLCFISNSNKRHTDYLSSLGAYVLLLEQTFLEDSTGIKT